MKNIIFCFLILVLASCSSSTSDPKVQNSDPAGIWLGYQTIIDSGVYDMKTLIYDGKIYGISEDAGVTYAGTYAMSHSSYLVSDGYEGSDTSYRLYDLNSGGEIWARGQVAAKVKEKESFTGTFENDKGQEGEVTSFYSALTDYPASISYITGHLEMDSVSLDVSTEGQIQGTLGSCDVSGTVSVPDPQRNLYQFQYLLSGCSIGGSYEGLGMIAEDDDGYAYFMGLGANETHMNGLSFHLAVQPDFLQQSSTATAASVTNLRKASSDYGVTVDDLCYSTDGYNYHYCNWRGDGKDDVNYAGIDFSNTEFSEMEIDWSNFDGAKFQNSFFNYETEIDTSSFVKADFSGSYFDANTFLDDQSTNPTNTYITWGFHVWGSDFTGANFSGARVTEDAECGFQSTLSMMNYAYFADTENNSWHVEEVSDGSYVTVVEHEATNWCFTSTTLGNAWWFDGKRCNAASIDDCYPKIYDNGLSYEEYLAGKSDLEKDAELAAALAKKAAKEAEKFVSDPVGTFRSWF